jgi:signal transduction histidine kinase
MRPLERIIRTAEGLTAADLGQRVPANATDDREFAQLISVLNGMMERLHLSFEQAARFTADASHELKTPLTVMHGTTHALLRRSAPGSAEHEQLESLACELSRLKSITHSLLILSQADAGKLPLQRETFDLSTGRIAL